jgi:hypothetical protein
MCLGPAFCGDLWQGEIGLEAAAPAQDVARRAGPAPRTRVAVARAPRSRASARYALPL